PRSAASQQCQISRAICATSSTGLSPRADRRCARVEKYRWNGHFRHAKQIDCVTFASENIFLCKIHGLSTNQANWIQIGRDSVEMRHILIESRVTGTSEAEA